MRLTSLALAQTLCRPFPPLLAQRLRNILYPLSRAKEDDRPFILRGQTGSRLRSRTGDFHGYPFAVHGYFEWRNLAVCLATCRQGDVVIEIGANVGTETIGFADIVGPSGCVHAFEPLPDNYAALRETIALNGDRTVVLHNAAVGAMCGKLRFAVPRKESSGTGHLLGAWEQTGEVIEVSCVTLDSVAEQIGPAKAIFIDAEGAECDILRGARQYLGRHHPVLVLEASPKLLKRAGATLQELYHDVIELEYEVHRISRWGLRAANPVAERSSSNWLCSPAGSDTGRAVMMMLWQCGLLPCIGALNPLRRVRYS